ncbi:MAG TPA: hypothetical protein VIF09_26245 [Polyangiaceae bacterium]
MTRTRTLNGARAPFRAWFAVGPAALALLVLVSSPAGADDGVPPSKPPVTAPTSRQRDLFGVHSAPTFLLFAAGAISAVTFHELGHAVTELAYGDPPTLTPVTYRKVFPWFVVDPRLTKRNGTYYRSNGAVFAGGARGYYVINMAGFMVQNIGSEIILTDKPHLVYEAEPFRKGLVWMNVALSVGYATASLLGVEDPHGDIYGASRETNIRHEVIAGVVLSNGVLDLLRYLLPDVTWPSADPGSTPLLLPWASRASKCVMLGMEFPLW